MLTVSRRLRALLLITGVVAAIAVPASADAATRIINGTAVDNAAYTARWSAMVALVDADTTSPVQGQFCGGTLIAQQLVLTAAHCVSSEGEYEGELDISKPSTVDVFAGSRTLSGVGQRFDVSEIIVHPDYDPLMNENDVALLELAAAPAPALPTLSIVGAGETASWGGGLGIAAGANGPWIGGWGTRDALSDSYAGLAKPAPNTLFEVAVPVIADDVCENGGGGADGLGRYFVPASMLCAGVLDTHDLSDANAVNNGKDSCYGDSGSPLIAWNGAVYRVAGVVSWGIECGLRNQYGVYTRMDAMRGWAESSPPAPVRNTEKPEVTGAALVGSELTCSDGTWTGGGAITYTYKWYREESDEIEIEGGMGMTLPANRSRGMWDYDDEELEVIDGATTNSYTPVAGDVNFAISCRVTATNASSALSKASDSTHPVLVDKLAPTIKRVSTKCSGGYCTTRLRVIDPEGAAISSVKAKVKRTNNGSTSYQMVNGEFVSGKTWTIKVRSKAGMYDVAVTAKDQFNHASKPFKFSYLV